MADNKAGYKQDTDSDVFFRVREAGTIGGDPVGDQYVADPDRAALIAAIQAVATQTTLAAVLTELGQKLEPADLAALASAAKQDAAQTTLSALLAAVDGLETNTAGLATQTTLAAINTELGQKLEAADLAALSTAAKQDAAKTVLDNILTSVDGLEGFTDGLEGSLTTLNSKDFATQTTLAAVLAKLIAAPATEAKQDTGNTALSALNGKVPSELGTWGYAGGAAGTVNIPASKKVLSIGAIATSSGATLAIDGGDSIPVPQNIGVDFSPKGNLVAPTIVFTGTASYSVEFVG